MSERVCYACGTPAPEGAEFCRQCGRDLDPEGPPEGEEETQEWVEPAPPQRSRLPLILGLLAALLVGILLVVLLAGGKDKKKTPPPVASTPATNATPAPNPADAARKAAVLDIDRVLRLAKAGRTALGAKDLKAATANRAQVLAALAKIKAPAGPVTAAVKALKTAFAYSLQLDKSCGLSCPAARNQQAQKLKVTALGLTNPLLKAGPGTSYTAGDI